jgi:hypothetical protein
LQALGWEILTLVCYGEWLRIFETFTSFAGEAFALYLLKYKLIILINNFKINTNELSYVDHSFF